MALTASTEYSQCGGRVKRNMTCYSERTLFHVRKSLNIVIPGCVFKAGLFTLSTIKNLLHAVNVASLAVYS
jgi:hypothetical protein